MNPLPPELLLPADPQGWNYDSPIFKDMVDQVKPTRIIEVGTWKGMSAIQFYLHAKGQEQFQELICCDTWLGGIEHMEGQAFGGLFETKHGFPDLYLRFLSNMQQANCMEKLKPIVNTSMNCARWLQRNNVKAQLIYIDGSHEQPDVYWDVKMFYDVLDQKGVMFGDDYNYPPVNQDVNKFCDEKGLSLQVLHNNYWVINKP